MNQAFPYPQLNSPLSPFLFSIFTFSLSVLFFLIYFLFESTSLGHFLFLLWGSFFLHLLYLSVIQKKANPCPVCGHRNRYETSGRGGRKEFFYFDCTSCEAFYYSFLELKFPLCEMKQQVIAPRVARQCVNCESLLLLDELPSPSCPSCYLNPDQFQAEHHQEKVNFQSRKNCPGCRVPFYVYTKGVLKSSHFGAPVLSTLFYCYECKLDFVYREAAPSKSPHVLGEYLPHRRHVLNSEEKIYLVNLEEKSKECPLCQKGEARTILRRDECPQDHQLNWCPHCSRYFFFNLVFLHATPISLIQCSDCGANLAGNSPLENENLQRCNHCQARLNPWVPEGQVLQVNPGTSLPTELIPCVNCRHPIPQVIFTQEQGVEAHLDNLLDPQLFGKSPWILTRCQPCSYLMKYDLINFHPTLLVENFKFFPSWKRPELEPLVPFINPYFQENEVSSTGFEPLEHEELK